MARTMLLDPGLSVLLLLSAPHSRYNKSRHQLFRQWKIIRGYVIYSSEKNKETKQSEK